MARGGIRAWGRVAAMLAVALLSLAVVRSQVMRAAELSPAAAPMCMAGMAMAGEPTGRVGKASAAMHRACDFCAAAANAPLLAATVTAPLPNAVAEPAPYAAHASLGPRGPPAFAPHARGPPLILRA